MWPVSRPAPDFLLYLYTDSLMISLMSSAVGQVRHHHHRELSSLIGLQWMQRFISLKWTVELSWLGIRSLHHPDIQLMVCYQNSVSVVHFKLQWTLCWVAVQTALACCDTLTTLIPNWHKIPCSRLQRRTQGKGGKVVVLQSIGTWVQ